LTLDQETRRKQRITSVHTHFTYMPKQSTQLTKRPIQGLLQEYQMPTPKTNKQVEQQTIELIETTVYPSLEELREQIQMLKTKEEKFLYACMNGTDDTSMQLCTELIEQSSSQIRLDKILDRKNANLSLMHILAMKNKIHSMELLAAHKSKLIDCLDNIHATPLLHAASLGHLEAVAFLLGKQANPNCRDTWGKFPLMVALKNKHYKVAELIASHHGVDVHLRGPKGNSLLHSCAADGDITGVKLLLEVCKASPQRRNNNEENVLQVCVAHTDIVQYLCTKIDGPTLQKMALNVDILGQNVVHECAKNGHVDSLVSILKSLNITDLSEDKVIQLLNTPDKTESTPLILATKQGQIQAVRLLCQMNEVQLNHGDEEGYTALHHAALLKDKTIVDMLTSVGASFKADNLENDGGARNGLDRFVRSLKTLLSVLLTATAVICILTIAGMCIL
jgi:ankyrin repeat protein